MSNNRCILIHESSKNGQSIVYVMSRDQRVKDNFALITAQQKANELSLPLVVVFNLKNKLQNRLYEHFEFMLEGLKEVAINLEKLNIPFVLTAEESTITLENCLETLKPAALYFDFSPFNQARHRVKTIAKQHDLTTYSVDTHNIIPVWAASDKQEFAAHTFRRKVHQLLSTYLAEPENIVKHRYLFSESVQSMTFKEAYEFISRYPKGGINITIKSGEKAAHDHVSLFITQKLEQYAQKRNDIAHDFQSGLSPYLHFGQIASSRVALDIMKVTRSTPLLFDEAKMASPSDTLSVHDGMNALFEEMIVRKELSDNFCFYNKDYQLIDSAPAWAITTLNHHKNDPREYVYDLDTFQEAQTHDVVWNAAQKELTKTGKMHGYMRMYWAKKILEWTSSPEEALQYAIYLNDSYSIDGMDPNGYAGILWSIAGLHDRPWAERPVFGKIRYMNEAGLRRKFDLDAYIKRIAAL